MTNTKKPAAFGRGFFYAGFCGRGLAPLAHVKKGMALFGTDVKHFALW